MVSCQKDSKPGSDGSCVIMYVYVCPSLFSHVVLSSVICNFRKAYSSKKRISVKQGEIDDLCLQNLLEVTRTGRPFGKSDLCIP